MKFMNCLKVYFVLKGIDNNGTICGGLLQVCHEYSVQTHNTTEHNLSPPDYDNLLLKCRAELAERKYVETLGYS
ncbi:CLUMA_CG006696, isoform A [Clunio marinus]|uniref:CLUMA_CG006696, isoform A n=1 Tax=Clunio marinus TaxID=568069 RepID=A0A1J1HZM3_9DIPT|nr:CLUMA_CG006696, isoform A [Clunio marinus]